MGGVGSKLCQPEHPSFCCRRHQRWPLEELGYIYIYMHTYIYTLIAIYIYIKKNDPLNEL